MPDNNLTLKQVREKLAAKQDELGKVFAEATVTVDGGQKSYDFNRVTCLGEKVKGSIAVAEQVKAMNAELNELAQQAETLEGAEKAARDQADREKVRNRPPMPGAKGNYPSIEERIKSLGEMVAEEKSYQDWAKSGAAGGITLQFDDLFPSDALAKGMAFETIGSKALMSTTAGWAPQSLRIGGFVEAATRPIQLLDIIPMAQTGFEQVVYMEETTRNQAAAETAEGGVYAESSFALTEKTSPVRKITDSLPVTDEQLEDVAQAQSYINSRLTFGLRQRLDGQVLVGNAVGSNLRGLKNVAGIQTQAKGTDPVPDTFFKAMTKVRLGGRAIPTHHVMHPTDWQNVRLLRTTDGIYIWGNPSEAGPERMWGLPVVQQDADAAGTGYVGSFQPAWLSLFERRGVDVQIGYVGAQFTEGRRTVRADMRFAFVVFRPAAFCQTTGL
ncbi:phage major capsid protein [Sinorhizobium medicae]|uniref:phage major capsid protein n=1 Tax=Sinorhizobium medicae TaxID=110321 RepID=UPI000FDC6478|nr:phage major capsid protein [Sinorhizobium medicae]RVJ42358.1 phage major capsid protein [Sinorhizobium medicae]WQO44898.1 phage major capsid protein [Sinorhizobium medicae]WQO65054.1 phage major capsid protein [Sinorhizobium medicae]WQO72140.1 phage major capsid protein [Sinorhizobium medicae]WQO91486.1 phage major capsid protein [Sinorhizobium medicae]